PARERNIDRAELQAIERALAHALPPLVLHVGRQSVIDGVAAGERWCTASRRPNTDLWRQVWARLRDIGLGPNGVQFRKVKIHRSAAVMESLDSEQRRVAQANKAADERTGRGAECGTSVVLQYIDKACIAAAEKIHYVLNSQTEITTRVLPDECCRGHVAAKLPMVFATAGAFSNGHRLWKTSTWVWCQRCGQHAQRRLAGLRGGCHGCPKQPWHLANLRAGRAPKAHADGPQVGVPTPLTEAEWEEWLARRG
ncbi:unnamed protein product, partial [Prorocentrum cordatum]